MQVRRVDAAHKRRLGCARAIDQAGALADIHPGQRIRMGHQGNRKAPVSRCRRHRPAQERQEHAGCCHWELHARRRWRVRCRGVFWRYIARPSDGSFPPCAPDGAGNAAICAELRNFRQRFQPVDCRQQLEIRAGNRAAWRRRIAELRHCRRVPRAQDIRAVRHHADRNGCPLAAFDPGHHHRRI